MKLSRVTVVVALVALAACAGRTMSFDSLYITGQEIRQKGAQSAYEVVVNHRELIVVAGDVAFRGGYDLDGDNEQYWTPLLIVDGNPDVGDVTTRLRRIPAEEIALIRLIHASEVSAEDRRPQSAGGIIEITTLHGSRSRL